MLVVTKPNQSSLRIAALLTALLSLAAPATIVAQTAGAAEAASPAQTAQEEAVRRQEATIQLRRKLDQAQVAEKKGDLNGAAKTYDEAYSVYQKIGGVGVEKEGQRLFAGMADVNIKLAQQAEKRGELSEASARIDRLVKVDPKNEAAIKYQAELAKALEAAKGRMPSAEMKNRIPEFKAERVNVNTLVQDGRVLLEASKMDEAEVKLEQAFKADPNNVAAKYYLNLVKEAKYRQEEGKRALSTRDKMVKVEEAWNPPVKGKSLPDANPFATTNRIYTGTGRQMIKNKLERIVLDQYPTTPTTADIPLSAVLEELAELSRLRDPDKQGVNFLVSSHLDRPTPMRQNEYANYSPLGATGAGPGFGAPAAVDPLTGMPTGSTAPTSMVLLKDIRSEVMVRITPTLRNVRLCDVLDAIEKCAESPSQPDFAGIKFSVEEYAVIFSQRIPEPEQLHNRLFRVDPNTFVQGLESVSSIYPVPGSNSSTTGGGNTGGGGNGGSQNGSSSSGGDIPRVSVSPFGSSQNGQSGGGGGGGFGGGGGGFGGGQGGQNGGGGMLSAYLGYGLTGVTRQTETRTIQDYVRQFFSTATGINFGGTDPNQNGQGGLGGGGGGGFTQRGGAGGGLGQNGQGGGPGTSSIRPMFFNDRTGVLFVRATMQELDLIDQAIQALNLPPPQVNLEAKFVEISQDDAKGLGFKWFLGNYLPGSGKIGMQGGSAPSYYNSSAISDANPTGVFPGPGTTVGGAGPAAVAAASTDGNLTSGVRDAGLSSIGTITGILTDPQFRVVINALDQRTGVDVMSAPSVTTLSGRQAHIESTVQRQILANVSTSTSNTGNTGGTTSTTGNGTVNQAQALPILTPTPVALPTGPTLDVIPYVSADGYTIQMTMIPSILDFLGYGNPDIADAAAYETSIKAQVGTATSTLPLPRIQIRQITTSAMVWDGQTVVLGGLISDNVMRKRDKVPFLGDIPGLGRLFRSESSTTSKKNLVVFVTARIIDPAGNKVHTDDNLPYDPSVMPVQKSTTITPAAN